MPLAAGLSAAQVAGTGTTVSIGAITGSTGSETFLNISEVKNADFSGFKRGVADATNFGSLGIKRNVGTIVDLGTISITANRVANDPGQIAMNAALLNGSPYDFKIVLPINTQIGQTTTGDTITCSALVTSAGAFSIELTTVSDYKFELTLNSYSVILGS